MTRYQRMNTDELQLELATAVHERECAQLAAIVNRDPTGRYVAVITSKILMLRRLLGNGAQ